MKFKPRWFDDVAIFGSRRFRDLSISNRTLAEPFITDPSALFRRILIFNASNFHQRSNRCEADRGQRARQEAKGEVDAPAYRHQFIPGNNCARISSCCVAPFPVSLFCFSIPNEGRFFMLKFILTVLRKLSKPRMQETMKSESSRDRCLCNDVFEVLFG